MILIFLLFPKDARTAQVTNAEGQTNNSSDKNYLLAQEEGTCKLITLRWKSNESKAWSIIFIPGPQYQLSINTRILGAVNPAHDRLAVWHTRDLPCSSLSCTDTESHFLFTIQQSKTRAKPSLAQKHPWTSAGREVLPLVSEAACHPKQHPQKNRSALPKETSPRSFTDGLHTFSLKHTQQFLFSKKKKREKGTVTGICIQNHIWIQGKLLGKKLTIESGAGALSKENERKERTIFCSYNGSTVLFVIISYREACTYNQFILESGLKHTNIYTQASSPAMVGNCHLQNWDQYWLCILKSQKVIQAIEAMGWATPRIWVWPVGVTLLALPGDMSALQRPGEAIPTQYIHNWGTVSQLAHIITHRHWFVATDFHHCTRRNHCYQEESRWPLTQTHFASKDIFQTQCLSYQICPSRSCVSSQPTWKTMWCDFSSTLRTEVHSHNSHLA